ncbi:peptidase M23 [Streptomyces sp. NPDC059708]|uniref:peptidase M23 n=1 Tax=Streptomyces sp. NPDC059708 TaxID=3346916 RepID=UPI0036A3D48A
MNTRDIAQAAATRAAAPLLAKLGCLAAVLATVLLGVLGLVTMIATGASRAAMDGKSSSNCGIGLPDMPGLEGIPERVLGTQVDNAKIIDQVAASRGLPGKAVMIALMTGLQESNLQNLDHGDADSLGLFQQRPSQGWGTRAEIMHPPTSSGLFYGANKGRPPGLVDINGWYLMPLGQAAQKVQRSAHPELYDTRQMQAKAIADKAGIDLNRIGIAGGMTGATPGSGLPPVQCPDGPGAGGAPVRDVAAGWPAAVANPHTVADARAWAQREAAAPSQNWFRACLAFVARAHGWHYSGVETALLHWEEMPESMKHRGSRDIPPGALMYWETSSPAGHVALYMGGGMVASNDIRRPGRIDIVPAAEFDTSWRAKYLGWAPPYFPKGS